MAIAFDATSSSEGHVPDTDPKTITWNHTCTGSNLFLMLTVWSGLGSGAGTPTYSSITYNGAAFTELPSSAHTDAGTKWRCTTYYLPAPASGTHTMSITVSGNTDNYVYALAASYTGVDQSTPIDAQGTDNNFTTANESNSVTTSADNAWAVMCINQYSGGTSVSAGASTTSRFTTSWHGILDSNAAVTPAGSRTLNATFGGASGWSTIFSLKPYAAPAGPANVKTINGLAKASVKTINGLAIASVKTWNGLA